MRRKSNLKMVWLTAILLLSPPLLAGCVSSRVNLYPIEKQDIMQMKKGESYAPDRDGYFLSNLYMEEVMQAKVDTVKRD